MANSGNNISLSKERLKGFEVDLNHLIDDFVLQVMNSEVVGIVSACKLLLEYLGDCS